MRLESGTQDLLSLTISGAPSDVLVHNVAAVARLLSPSDTRAAVLVHDRERGMLKVAGSAGFHADFCAHAQDIPVREDYPSCGRCAATGAEVFVRDVVADPLWERHLEFARTYDFRACWSFPIVASTGVLGTIAVYHRVPRLPDGIEVDAIRYLTAIAAVALTASEEPQQGARA